MKLRHRFWQCLLFLLPSGVLYADTLVLRDGIGADTSLTNGMPGVIAQQDGFTWFTPGLVVNVPEYGELTEARFVIFVHTPENNLGNIYGFPMEFHVWSDGIEGGADSFDENPRGQAVSGHIDIDVNTQTNFRSKHYAVRADGFGRLEASTYAAGGLLWSRSRTPYRGKLTNQKRRILLSHY